MVPPGKVTEQETGRFVPVNSINAHWTASSGTLVLEAKGTADSSPFDVLVDGKLAHRVTAAGRVSFELALGPLKPGTSVQLWLPPVWDGQDPGSITEWRGRPPGDGVRQTLADVRQFADALPAGGRPVGNLACPGGEPVRLAARLTTGTQQPPSCVSCGKRGDHAIHCLDGAAVFTAVAN